MYTHTHTHTHIHTHTHTYIYIRLRAWNRTCAHMATRKLYLHDKCVECKEISLSVCVCVCVCVYVCVCVCVYIYTHTHTHKHTHTHTHIDTCICVSQEQARQRTDPHAAGRAQRYQAAYPPCRGTGTSPAATPLSLSAIVMPRGQAARRVYYRRAKAAACPPFRQ